MYDLRPPLERGDDVVLRERRRERARTSVSGHIVDVVRCAWRRMAELERVSAVVKGELFEKGDWDRSSESG